MSALQDRRRRYTEEQLKRLRDVAAQRRLIPSDKELARELGVSLTGLQSKMSKMGRRE